MDPAAVLKLVIVASIMLIVFAIGLGSTPGAGLRFLRAEPASMVRAMLAMFVAIPAFMLLVTSVLPLDRPVRLALLALAVSPMPPILPRKEQKLGGSGDFIAATLLVAPLVAMLAIPLYVAISESLFGHDASYSPMVVLKTLIMTLGAPLLAGLIVRRLSPAVAGLLERPVGTLGTILLALGALVLLWSAWPAMWAAIGNGTLVAIAAFVVFGLVVGHWLGGPAAGNRRALAVTTASRHPGVAIAVAAAAFPADSPAIVGAVLLYLVVNGLIGLAYTSLTARMVSQSPARAEVP